MSKDNGVLHFPCFYMTSLHPFVANKGQVSISYASVIRYAFSSHQKLKVKPNVNQKKMTKP